MRSDGVRSDGGACAVDVGQIVVAHRAGGCEVSRRWHGIGGSCIRGLVRTGLLARAGLIGGGRVCRGLVCCGLGRGREWRRGRRRLRRRLVGGWGEGWGKSFGEGLGDVGLAGPPEDLVVTQVARVGDCLHVALGGLDEFDEVAVVIGETHLCGPPHIPPCGAVRAHKSAKNPDLRGLSGWRHGRRKCWKFWPKGFDFCWGARTKVVVSGAGPGGVDQVCALVVREGTRAPAEPEARGTDARAAGG